MAKNISKSLPCPGGGLIAVQGTIDETTGSVDLSLATTNCMVLGIGIAATGTVTGTIEMSMLEATADIDLQTAISTTLTSTSNSTTTASLAQTVTGTYDMTTGMLAGDITSTWSGSGEITILLEDAFALNKIVGSVCPKRR